MKSDAVPHVELRGVSKRFGATLALDGVDLAIQTGHIHALVGENGAGKSTLGKLLAGVHRADEGEIRLQGRPVDFSSPREALEARVTIVAQELSLLPERTVVDNVYLGVEAGRGPWVASARMRAGLDGLMRRTGIELAPEARVGTLSVAEQQKVEILRALARDARLIVMDEPTARLSGDEIEALYSTVRTLAEQGTAVVYVSHFLDEVLELADMVTVMRDGHVVSTRQAADHTKRTLIEEMTGRSMERAFPERRRVSPDAPVVLHLKGLTAVGRFRDIEITVRAGEIVVLAGLVGSGRSEVAHAVAGADRFHAGEMTLDGAAFRPRSPAAALRRGIVMIPESRKDQGLVLERSVRENITLPYLGLLSRAGWLRQGPEQRIAAERAKRVGVRAAGLDSPVATLSGGNQQKVLFARALVRTPQLLIADEPTRGVDVGAKRAIYDLITDLAADGLAVLMVSSELEEVLGLAHRIYVLHEGSIVSEQDGETATEHSVMSAAFDADADELFDHDEARGR